MEKEKFLIPLKFSSSYFYSIEPNYDFTITSEMIRAEQLEQKDELGRFNGLSLGSSFQKPILGFEEERNISIQVFRCCIPKIPVEDVLNRLTGNWDSLCLTQRQMKAFLKNHGKNILSILSIEEPKLPSRILFLGKHDQLNDPYRLVSSRFMAYSEDKLDHVICSFDKLSFMGNFAFFVVPLSLPPEILYNIS